MGNGKVGVLPFAILLGGWGVIQIVKGLSGVFDFRVTVDVLPFVVGGVLISCVLALCVAFHLNNRNGGRDG